MTIAKSIFHGIAQGHLIELESDSGLPKGQPVTITIEPRRTGSNANLLPGEGIRRSAGAWAEDADELNEFLETSRLLRRSGSREIPE